MDYFHSLHHPFHLIRSQRDLKLLLFMLKNHHIGKLGKGIGYLSIKKWKSVFTDTCSAFTFCHLNIDCYLMSLNLAQVPGD